MSEPRTSNATDTTANATSNTHATAEQPTPPRSTLGPKPTDDARRADIARIRRRATGLLVVAAVVYVIAKIYEEYAPWVGYVRATAEASLVGGLAGILLGVGAFVWFCLGLRFGWSYRPGEAREERGATLAEGPHRTCLE